MDVCNSKSTEIVVMEGPIDPCVHERLIRRSAVILRLLSLQCGEGGCKTTQIVSLETNEI